MKNRILVATSSRSEYGLLRELLKSLEENPRFELTLLVTGGHLKGVFGNSIQEILEDDFKKIEIVEIGSEEDPHSYGKIVGELIAKVCSLFERVRPDLVLLLGDRYEIFGISSAAMLCDIPIAHIHGGEITTGSKDELHRHSISKMSSIHFVANDEFKNRLMKMGEQPSTVFVVGGLGVESIANLKIIPRGQLQQELGITFEPLTALVSYHPDTIKSEESGIQINSLIAALDKFPEIALIITGSNADNGGTLSTLLLKGYSESRENAVFFENLGQTRFLSSLSYVDFIIGNSSSGLLEAPSMKIGTVNLGNRQSGRPRAISVVDADFNPSNIEAAIKHVISDEFKKTLANCTNPYGKTGASVKILEILETIDFHQLLPKQFYDEGGMTHDAS